MIKAKHTLPLVLSFTLSNPSFAAEFDETSCQQDAKTTFAKSFCHAALNKSNINQSMLGYLYLEKPEEIKTSDEKGFYWIRAASRNCINHGFGQISEMQKQILIQNIYDTGELYRQGKGTQQNDKNALFWYQKAANQGYLPAYKKLVKFHIEGRGTPVSAKQSFRWLNKAAEKKDADSQFRLGIYYETGQGVKANKLQAMKWYQKACQNNKKAACTAYQNLVNSI